MSTKKDDTESPMLATLERIAKALEAGEMRAISDRTIAPHDTVRQRFSHLWDPPSAEKLERDKPVFVRCRSPRTGSSFRAEVRDGKVYTLHEYRALPPTEWPRDYAERIGPRELHRPRLRLNDPESADDTKLFVDVPPGDTRTFIVDWSGLTGENGPASHQGTVVFIRATMFTDDAKAIVGAPLPDSWIASDDEPAQASTAG